MKKATMINWLKERRGEAVQKETNNHWIDTQYDEFRYTLTLSGIEDHFDANGLWRENGSKQQNIVNKSSDARSERLEWVLKQCQRAQLSLIAKTGVYQHILVWLPSDIWELALRFDEKAVNRLQTRLTELHQESFNEKQNDIRYQILHSDQLHYNEIAFQFGHSIYIAGSEEAAIGHIQIKSTNSHGLTQAITDLPISHDSRLEGNHNQNIYQGQEHIFVLNPTNDAFLKNSQTWTVNGCDYIHIKIHKGCWQAYNGINNPDVLIHSSEKDNEIVFEVQSTDSKQGMQPKLWITLNCSAIIKPEAQEQADNFDSTTFSTPPPTQNSDSTILIQPPLTVDSTLFLSDSPLLQPALILEAIAFPRIDSAAGMVPTLKSWRIWLDQNGELLTHNQITDSQRQSLPNFIAHSNKKRLFLRATESDPYQALELPTAIQMGEHSIEISLANFLPERFHGVLSFPSPVIFKLEPDRDYRIGRKTPQNTQHLDIDLAFLSDQKSMVWNDHSPHLGHTLSSLVLSRLNVIATASEEGNCQITAHGSAPVYVLTEDENQVITLQSKETNEYTLELNQRFIVGCFILRYGLCP